MITELQKVLVQGHGVQISLGKYDQMRVTLY